MADDALDGMYVEFLADYDSLDSAEGNISAKFAAIAESAAAASMDITESLGGADESLQALASAGEETAATVEESLGTVNFEGFQSALASLTEAVDAATSQINEQLASIPTEAEDSAAKSQGAFSHFSLTGMVQHIGLTIFGFQNMANMATQLAGGLLQPAENAENMQASFTNLTGSAQAASDELAKLDDFAAHTQFTTMDIDAAGAQLLGFKFKAQDIIPDIQAIGDNLSAVGKGTPAEIQSVIDIFGKMSTQGKLTAMDINQLGAHGITALADIAAGSGKTTKQIQEMIAKGTLPANQAIADLTKGIEMNPIYSGGMAKQSGTLSGMMSTLSSDWDVFMATIMKPALPLLEQGLSKLTTLLTDPNFKKFATVVGQDIVKALVTMTTDIGNLITTGENIVNFFKGNQTAMNALIAVLITGAGIIAGVLIPALIGWAIAQWAVAAPVIATAAPFIALGLIVAAVIFGIIEAVQHWGEIAHWIQGVWGDLTGWFNTYVVMPFKIQFEAISANVAIIGTAFGAVGKVFGAAWQGMVAEAKGGINTIISGIDSFIGFIDGIQIHIPAIGVGPVHSPAFDWGGLGIPKIPLLATGGQVGPGLFVAGDEGPEIVDTSGGATVFNRGQTAAMLGGGGETHVHVYLDGREMAHFMVDAVGNRIVKKLLSQGPVKAVA